jgi:predicted nucleotidyltransferase
MSHVKRLNKLQRLNAPPHVTKQLQYEVIMGSFAYGCSSDLSDTDIYGFCIPKKEIVFPHLNRDYIHGFDAVPKNFEQYQEHHIMSPPRQYDITIYNIVKYFKLCANGNPNMIDSLFVPNRCVTFMTPIGEYVRENRKLFLSKKCWHTFKGYSYAQLHKMNIKQPEGKRKLTVEKYGYDVKFAYHLVRLLDEIEQIMLTGDLDLEQNREQLKAIRRGEWTQGQVERHFEGKEKLLEKLAVDTREIPHKVQWGPIRELLFKCLEMHFNEIDRPAEEDVSSQIYHGIMNVLNKFEGQIK